jgi:folate-dependent phosphoribosylglycinamide formyltransferase PurN
MRIVFFTAAAFRTDELFRYVFAHVAARFPDVHIVAVCTQRGSRRALRTTLRRYMQKIRHLGLLSTLEIVMFYPLQLWLSRRDESRVHTLMQQLARPAVMLDTQPVQYVQTVNGGDAVHMLGALQPDIIIQAGAGILRPRIFTLARLATLNLHHGIAPLIRGMHSIYWALWEGRPEWLGATVHCIDAGIDTGQVLAYAPVTPCIPGEDYPSLYVRATQEGVARLVEVLTRLEAGEQWCLPPPAPGNTYRSTVSGLKLLLLQYKLARQRWPQAAPPVPSSPSLPESRRP